MVSLKETATAYEPKQTLNIADLDKVDLSCPIEERKGTNKDGEDFTYSVLIFGDKEYRTPATVLEEIKKILAIRPNAQYVNVNKTGSGLSTRYTVDLLKE